MDRHRPARPRATVRPPRHLLTAAQARSPPHPIAPLFFYASLQPTTKNCPDYADYAGDPGGFLPSRTSEATCPGLVYSLPDHCHPTPPNCKTLRSAPPHGVNPVDHTITDGRQTRMYRACIPNSGEPKYAEPPCSSPAIPRRSKSRHPPSVCTHARSSIGMHSAPEMPHSTVTWNAAKADRLRVPDFETSGSVRSACARPCRERSRHREALPLSLSAIGRS